MKTPSTPKSNEKISSEIIEKADKSKKDKTPEKDESVQEIVIINN